MEYPDSHRFQQLISSFMSLDRISETDAFWNERARQEKNDDHVNIADATQRELETSFILNQVRPDDRVLEVGCGNGWLTSRLRAKASWVDSFDYAANMVERAKSLHGEKNNRFFTDNVLNLGNTQPPYSLIICVRVLINLQSLEEQKQAVSSLAAQLAPGGRLVLIEGYLDGFQQTSLLRERCGMSALTPAAINYYSPYAALLEHIRTELHVLDDSFHTGTFDLLTRVVYPLIAGENAVNPLADFHVKTAVLAEKLSLEALKPFARLRGLVLGRK